MVRPAAAAIPDRTDPAFRATSRTLRRIMEAVDTVRYGTVIARFEVFQHGGHRRPVITRGAKHLRFRFTSAKTGLTQLGEGKGEEFFAYCNEVDGLVGDYQCHPGEIEISRPGGSFRYRPDALRHMLDGTVELIEVKRTPADVDADLRERFGYVREVARRCGWRFRVLYDDDVFGATPETRRVRKRNVEGAFSRRSLSLTPVQRDAARRVVNAGAPVTWKDLGERLAPGDVLSAYAAIESLLARGFLATDLDAVLRPSTILHPTPRRRDGSLIRF